MNTRGTLTFLVAEAVLATMLTAFYSLNTDFGTDYHKALACSAVILFCWTALRLLLISVRKICIVQGLGTGVAFAAELLALQEFTEFKSSIEPQHIPLGGIALWAICPYVFGRMLDYFILRPYFPRRPIS